MERMSPQDVSFLHLEAQDQPLHIGSIAIFEGPAPHRDEVCRLVTAKLPKVPRYRQKVRFVPLRLERPVWVDDPHFTLDYHLRDTALPQPGGPEELRRVVGRVMGQHLDRAKPLWEMWIVSGLEDGHWALISKTHHCMVDGVASTDLLTQIMDDSPDVDLPDPPAWEADPEPSNLDLLVNAAVERSTSPRELVRAIRRPKAIATRAVATLKGGIQLAGLARPVDNSSLTGMSGPHRRWAYARTSLDDIKTIRSGLGGTVNDVILTAVTQGYRGLLMAHGDDTSGAVLRSLVPVSVRKPDEEGTANNRVSAMFVELPVSVADPVERLHRMREQMLKVKESGEAVAADSLMAMSGFAPPLLLSLGARATARFPQRGVNTVTTNVPGPQYPLYALGHRMLEAFPYVPIGSSMRVGTAMFSYDGQLNVGVTADYDAVPDLTAFTVGVEDGIRELLKAAEAA